MKNTYKMLMAATALCGCLALTAPARAEMITTQETAVTAAPENDLAVTPVIVASLQEQLKEAGYYQARVDGHLDAKTRDALASFQSSRGLAPSGAVTGMTLAELGIVSDATDVAMVAPENIEPAAGGSDNSGFFHRLFGTETTAEPRIDANHENGASCMNCTNGIIGNAGTASMRANEY